MSLTTLEPQFELPPPTNLEPTVHFDRAAQVELPVPVVTNEFYCNLASLAIEEDWEYSAVPLGRGALQVRDMVFPDSLGGLATMPWYRSIIRGSANVTPEGYASSASLTMQPVFTGKLDDKLPSFVRVYDGQHGRLSTTLNVLEPHLETRTQTLHRLHVPWVLADCLGVPAVDTRTPVRV